MFAAILRVLGTPVDWATDPISILGPRVQRREVVRRILYVLSRDKTRDYEEQQSYAVTVDLTALASRTHATDYQFHWVHTIRIGGLQGGESNEDFCGNEGPNSQRSRYCMLRAVCL